MRKVEKLDIDRIHIEVNQHKMEGLEVETIVRKQTKSSGIFYCCNKLMMCFKKNKTYDNLGDNEKPDKK